jgi:hypothetical protein
VSNGKGRYDRRSSTSRRLDDLAASYLAAFDAPDEAAVGLARSAALAAARIERLEVREVKGEAIDDECLVRLMGAHSRALAALDGLKARKTQSASADEPPGDALQRHLAELASRRAPAPLRHGDG